MPAVFWVSLAVVSFISAVILRICVRVLAKQADNGWDNAGAYLLASYLTLWGLKAALMGSAPWVWLLLPVLLFVVQVVSLRFIYEIGAQRALLINVVHSTVAGLTLGTLLFAAGVVAAYIFYGRIVSDPLLLIRILCRLIGIEPPF